MMIRLGIPACFARFGAVAAELGAPVLVSANAFWRRDGSGFKALRPETLGDLDVGLDSSGYVAMAEYGGYRWGVPQFVGFAGRRRWAWWASMDYCCEPEVLKRRGATVAECIAWAVEKLIECQDEAERQGVTPPMPVLQGWGPDDYLRCYEAMRTRALPDLLGVGSVCRRHLGGSSGLLQVIAALDCRLPARHRLHLFGVKGSAIPALAGHPRVASVDSMASDAAARWEAYRGGFSCTVEHRANHMRRWYAAQLASLALPQMRLAV